MPYNTTTTYLDEHWTCGAKAVKLLESEHTTKTLAAKLIPDNLCVTRLLQLTTQPDIHGVMLLKDELNTDTVTYPNISDSSNSEGTINNNKVVGLLLRDLSEYLLLISLVR